MSCPEVDDALSAEANHARFVAHCGEVQRCGRRFARVRTHEARFLVPVTQVHAVRPAYPRHLPAASALGPVCIQGRTRPEGADFQSFVHGEARRLPGHVPVALCRRAGGRLLAWAEADHGWLARDAAEWGDARIPEAAFAPDGQLCRRPLWSARALRETRLFVPGNDAIDEHVVLAPDSELSLLEVETGAERWLLASAGTTVGWVLAADVALAPGLAWSDPEPTQGACPEAETTVLLRSARIGDWRLPAGAVAWRSSGSRSLRLAGVVVSPEHARQWAQGRLLGPWQSVQRAWKGPRWLAQLPWSDADAGQSPQALSEGLPSWLSEKDLAAPATRSPVAPTELSRRVASALTVAHQPAAAGRRLLQLGSLGERAWHVARAITDGRLEDALFELPARSPTLEPAEQHLWAEVLLRLGCAGMAAEVWLSMVAQLLPKVAPGQTWSFDSRLQSREGRWLHAAMHGYREAARRWHPHPGAAAVFAPWCAQGASDACFLGLHAAVVNQEDDRIQTYLQQLSGLPLMARERALVATVVAQTDGGAQAAALLLAQATGQACRQCDVRSELVQTLVLQTTRAARDAGDSDAAELAGAALVPAVWAAHPDLAARRLPPDNRSTAQWLLHLRRTGQAIEAELWQAAIATDSGRLTRAGEALKQAQLRLSETHRLLRWLEARPPGHSLEATLRSLDLVLRKAGVVSRDVPELARALAPAGVCGRWLELVQEHQLLARGLAHGEATLPRWLAIRAGRSRANLADACRRQLDAAPRLLAQRLRELELQHEAATIDLDEAQVRALDAHLRQLQDR
jgi:hypothetical protein